MPTRPRKPETPVVSMLRSSVLAETWQLCFVANHFIGPMYRAIEESSGISRPEFVVMFCVGHQSGLVAQDVADMSGLPRNTISRGVNSLLAKSLLVRAPPARGLRDRTLQLTPQGHALYAQLVAYPAQRRQAMLAHISPTERKTLERLLLKLAEAVPVWGAPGNE
jgi:MarR family transcriptional regulator, temperature-dependent positive regulator of motility